MLKISGVIMSTDPWKFAFGPSTQNTVKVFRLLERWKSPEKTVNKSNQFNQLD